MLAFFCIRAKLRSKSHYGPGASDSGRGEQWRGVVSAREANAPGVVRSKLESCGGVTCSNKQIKDTVSSKRGSEEWGGRVSLIGVYPSACPLFFPSFLNRISYQVLNLIGTAILQPFQAEWGSILSHICLAIVENRNYFKISIGSFW